MIVFGSHSILYSYFVVKCPLVLIQLFILSELINASKTWLE